MKQYLKEAFRGFSIELPLYTVFVVAYGLLVLHFLGGWLFRLFTTDRELYAVTSLALIVGQGFLLEIFSRGLLRLANGKGRK